MQIRVADENRLTEEQRRAERTNRQEPELPNRYPGLGCIVPVELEVLFRNKLLIRLFDATHLRTMCRKV